MVNNPVVGIWVVSIVTEVDDGLGKIFKNLVLCGISFIPTPPPFRVLSI